MLVPKDHLLRKFDAAVDFSCIHDLCKYLYSPDNVRPAVEPELLYKMLNEILRQCIAKGLTGGKIHRLPSPHAPWRTLQEMAFQIRLFLRRIPLSPKTPALLENHHPKRLPEYFSAPKKCTQCPVRSQCFGASTTRRMVERHVWQDDLDDVTAFTQTPMGRQIYKWRKETIERSFAEGKQNHGLRFARILGIKNMCEQCFLFRQTRPLLMA